MKSLHLTKSRYLDGLRCEKQLWMSIHQPKLGTEPEPGQQGLMEQGTEVGRAAHELYPGGVLVEETSDRFESAIGRTQALLADPAVPALFEAAFEYEGVRIRVDILERLEGGRFGLREVKSATSVKDEHLPDLELQLWVLRECGVEISSVELILVDNHYVLESDTVEWNRFFTRFDLTARIEGMLERTGGRVARMHEVMSRPDCPDVEPGSRCKKPHLCEFWQHCTEEKAPEWFVTQQRVNADLQAHRFEAARTGKPWVAGSLAGNLTPAEPPVWYLDFEALGPAIPIYRGTRPYETLPFQWSLHRLDERGGVEHREFLARGDEEPSVETSEALLAELTRDDAPIVVYSSFEKRMLSVMARKNPARAEELLRIQGRLFDLFPLIKRSIYFAELRGSFSIKRVGPVLAPDIRYDDLGDLAEGNAAAAAFARIATGAVSNEEEARIRKALLAYCERDTLAMMEVHRALGELVVDR